MASIKKATKSSYSPKIVGQSVNFDWTEDQWKLFFENMEGRSEEFKKAMKSYNSKLHKVLK